MKCWGERNDRIVIHQGTIMPDRTIYEEPTIINVNSKATDINVIFMSFIGFFTGNNDKIKEMESLINKGFYKDALELDFKVWALSNDDFNKIKYLEALCWLELEKYGEAQRSIVWILNNPSGAGIYEEKAKELSHKISERERGNSVVFPKESFRFFIEDCICADSEERRFREGIDKTNYYNKIQIYDNTYNKCFTFYWKPISSQEGELFVYLGEDIDGFCKKIDENAIERSVYTKSLKNIGNLYNRGRNGACLTPTLYRTVDFTKPNVLLKGNTYVLGIRTFKSLPSQFEKLGNEIAKLLEAFEDIMSDISKGVSTTDKIKIYISYLGQGIIDKVLAKEFMEVGKLISIIMKNKLHN